MMCVAIWYTERAVIMAEEKKVRGQIHFRITPEEAAIIEQKAEAVNLSPTMYAKKMAVLGKVKPQVIGKELGQAMLPHISHMGSNINQLAKRANEGGTVAAAELAEVKAEFEQLWDLVLYGKKPKPRKSEEQKLEEATGQKTALYAAALPFASIPTSRTRIIGFARTTPRRRRGICSSGWSKWLIMRSALQKMQ